MSRIAVASKRVGTLLAPMCAMAVASAASAQGHCRPADRLSISNVTVIDVIRGRALPHETVLIGCGKILALGPSRGVKGRTSVRQIDGNGLYLSPGLVDAHAHATENDRFRTDYLAYGITTVRNMDGSAQARKAADQVEQGSTPGPWVYLASPIIYGSEPEWKAADALAAARAIVEKAKLAGFEYVKVYYQLTPAQFAALSRAAREAHMPLIGHVPRSISLQTALKHFWSIEHLTGFDDALEDPLRHVEGPGSAMLSLRRFAAADRSRIPVLAKLVAWSGVWQVPTLFTYDVWTHPEKMRRLTSDPTIERLIGSDVLKEWVKPNPWYVTPLDKQTDADRAAIAGAVDVRSRMVKALYDAGAKIAVGTDSPSTFMVPGLAFHEELKLYRQAGIPAPAILRMATINGARVTRHESAFGSIEVGKRADLLLLKDNPLRDLATLGRATAVIAAGRYYPLAELNRSSGGAPDVSLPIAN